MKRFPKLLLLAMLAVTSSASLSSCEDNNDNAPDTSNQPSGPTDPTGRVILSGDITANRTLRANEKYLLQGFVRVKDGITLTIEPGTKIFGDQDTKGTLVVERGGKIIAEGTQTNPIVFTSAKAPGSRKYGDWGGVVLVGRAPINQPLTTEMEGGIGIGFGGTVANDNSGSLKYVRIEFAGIPLSTRDNSEINGLTLYGVGSGTQIDYVQVSYSGDDSFEWFGGTVNAKHLVAHRGWDDDFDTDFGYTGKVQYAVSLRDPAFADFSASNGFESDNFNPGTPATGDNAGFPLTAPIFSNVSVFVTGGTPPTTQASGSGVYQSAMHIRRNTAISIYNSVFVGQPEGLRMDGVATWANVQSGAVNLKGVVLANNNTPLAVRNNTGSGSFTADDLTTWFNAAGKNNSIIPSASLSSLGLNTASFSLTTPSFLPQTGSSLLTGAIFDGKASDAFFDKVTFKGAFGTENWMQGWTNFDPQNTAY
ncbi:cell shape-determining protein MreB [Hymenobacter weizhouensis]|uniref:cell shape-determining protein MreB n=1 Tax=Hymenobacter sp. YIM 151500-1 TaxID=2987689 RepID=UPI0022273BE2|nr:cell shape-determining protein MreB [Hymenobacter sp. YIM 151500-1]UYZ62730.1 cell shape-determining protein MreB [Hymenobacter sp. YIM 151500-1]